MKGSVLYDMLTGKPPFYSKNRHEILKNITSRQVPIPPHLSWEARSLLRDLFKIDPKNRLGSTFGAQEIKKHPFFANIDFEQLYHKKIKPPITFISADLNPDGFDKGFMERGKSLFQE